MEAKPRTVPIELLRKNLSSVSAITSLLPGTASEVFFRHWRLRHCISPPMLRRLITFLEASTARRFLVATEGDLSFAATTVSRHECYALTCYCIWRATGLRKEGCQGAGGCACELMVPPPQFRSS